MPGSQTTRDRTDARDSAAARIAFRITYGEEEGGGSAGERGSIWRRRRGRCRIAAEGVLGPIGPQEPPGEISALFAEVGGESDRAALGWRRVHELTDRREDGGDRLVMSGELLLDACLELIETAGEFLVRGEELPQLHEGAHDIDAHLDGAEAVECGGGLDGAVLGEGVGKITATAAAGGC
jgi:hypothetical protein